jgi:hypothetical protein
MERERPGIRALAVVAALAVSGARSQGALIRVPGDFPDIQRGLDAAAAGDTVLVAEGDYPISAPLTFRGKALTLRAEAGPETTVIRMSSSPDEKERANVVVFEDGEGREAVLDGFTLTGGSPDGGFRATFGGGILLRGASPRIVHCTIAGNRAGRGGGIACLGSAPLIEDCRILANAVGGFGPQEKGGGLYAEDSAPVVIRCEFSGNLAPYYEHGGGVYAEESVLRLEDCDISENDYSGLNCSDSDLTLVDCRVRRNGGPGIGLAAASRASLSRCDLSGNALSGLTCREASAPALIGCTIAGNAAGGISSTLGSLLVSSSTISGNTGGGVLAGEGPSPEITGSIIWGNSGPSLSVSPSAQPRVSFSCIEGVRDWPGEGNISIDPLFCGGGPAKEVQVDASQAGPGDGTAASPYPSLEPALEYSLALSRRSPCRGAGPGGADLGAPAGSCDEPGAESRVVRLAPGKYDAAWLNLAHRISVAGSGETNTEVRGTVLGLRTGATLSDLSVTGGDFGVLLDRGESPNVDRSTFFGIQGGAVACLEGADARLTGCTIRQNLFGVTSDGASPRLTRCEISGNQSSGFYCAGPGSPMLDRCTIRSNGGTGVSCRLNCAPTLLDCSIVENNEVDVDSDWGGGAAVSGGASLTMIRCHVSGNRGTGVTCREADSTATLINCTITGNVSIATPGGGVFATEASPRLINCLISANRGGGLNLMAGSSPTLFNCTITDNPGGGVRCVGEATPVLTNCIVWANPEEDPAICGQFFHTLTDRDPLFRRAGRFDFTRFREPVAGRPFELPDFIEEAGDYRLGPGSPAIDAGEARGAPQDDLEGHGRPCGPAIDLGAYESGDCGAKRTLFIRGDANADGARDLSDAVSILGYLFLGDAGAVRCAKSADSNDDGLLDLTDAVSLLSHLFLGGPPPADPYERCGEDPTPDPLDCQAFPPCP